MASTTRQSAAPLLAVTCLFYAALGCSNPKPNQPANPDATADITADTTSDTQADKDAVIPEVDTDATVDTSGPEQPTATATLFPLYPDGHSYFHEVGLEVGLLGIGIWQLEGWYLTKHPDIAGPWKTLTFAPNNKQIQVTMVVGLPGDYEVCAEVLEVATGAKSAKCVPFTIAVLPGHHFLFVHSGKPLGKTWDCGSYAWVNLPALVTLPDQSQATCAQATDDEYLAGDGNPEQFEHGGELTPMGWGAFPLATALAISQEPTATAVLDVMTSYGVVGQTCKDFQLQVLEFKEGQLVWQSPVFALSGQSGKGPVKAGALVLPAGGTTATASWIPCTDAVDLCPDATGLCATVAP
jgi:hypothetical protein